MEACNEPMSKKPRRSFVEGWLSDDRYKSWIRKVESDESAYFCIICKKNFSCNAAHVSRHTESACHRNNVKKSLPPSHDNDAQSKSQHKGVFKYEWLDINDYKSWLREVPGERNLCFCAVCEKSFVANLSHVRRHGGSASHVDLSKKKRVEASESNTQNEESFLSFDVRKKSAEIRYAAFIVEKNIPHQTAQEILTFFQDLGQDPNVLKNMTMGRTKCKNIISNVLCPIENEHVVKNLQKTRFSVFIDETSDGCNEKWMTFFVRYVDSETLDIRSQLVKLINIDARDYSAEKLFNAFKYEMWKLQIPFLNIVALSCDNTSVVTGKNSLFKAKLEEMCKRVLIFPCPCHSAALVAHAACAKIPSFCDEFLRKIANYINSTPKRSAIFKEFCGCLGENYRKILKLSDTSWLSHYTYVERLLHSWDTITHFLQEMITNDKTKSAEQLLSMMYNVELKAYFLFLKYILNFFNAFNVFFQSSETKIHLLQVKSTNLLLQVCKNFVKDEYLKNISTITSFSRQDIQKDSIFLGSECEGYLRDLTMESHVDIVATVRHNCLQFYHTAAEEIRKRLAINNDFLKKLQIFGPIGSLFNDNRKSSFYHVSFVARTLGDFDEESLRKEWHLLSTDFTLEEKKDLSKLNFDEMWKRILQRELWTDNYKYPTLRGLMSAIRALPNSNADPERTFSLLMDLKSKKRNKLSSTCVNASCVIKSALKTRDERAVKMEITQEHLHRMSADVLYASCQESDVKFISVDIADEEDEEVIDDAGPSK